MKTTNKTLVILSAIAVAVLALIAYAGRGNAAVYNMSVLLLAAAAGLCITVLMHVSYFGKRLF